MPSCFNKGFDPKCRNCREGNYALCENQSEGSLPMDTGGGWSEFMVAHESQLVAVPDEISDEDAVLIEPAAVALHAILLRAPEAGEKILIVGAGIIGLMILHITKQIQPECQVSIVARHRFQQEQAVRFGADAII